MYVPGVLSGLDGTDSNPKAIDYNSWEGALTTNVVLWPKPYTIVMNRDAFDALTSEQQEILRDAGREALAPELDELVRDSSEALSAACARGALTLVSASAADRRGAARSGTARLRGARERSGDQGADRRHHRDALGRARRGARRSRAAVERSGARMSAPPRSRGAGS